MKDKFSLKYYSLTLLFVIGAFFTLTNISTFSRKSKELKIEHAEKYVFMERVTNPGEWTGSVDHSGNNIHDELIIKADKYYTKAVNFGYIFILGSVVFLLLIYLFYKNDPLLYRFLTLGLIVVGICCLVIGVFSPMMEIIFFNDDYKLPLTNVIPEQYRGYAAAFLNIEAFDPVFEGRTYHSYHYKSIKEVIIILFRNGSYIVGTAILLFSVVFPLTKLILSMGLIVSERLRDSKVVSWLAHNIGKWSMADVFVVGVFLAYFSLSNLDNDGAETETNALIGLYFFLAYVIISIFSTYLLDRAIVSKSKTSEIPNH